MKPTFLRLDATQWVYMLLNMILFGLGVFVFNKGGLLWQGVGTSLVASGITGWVIFIYVFLSQETSEKIRLLTRFGVVAVFTARSARIKPEYDRRLNHARDHIDVLGFGLSHLREDFLNDFRLWKQRAHVRILLIDPEYPNQQNSYASQRDREERNPSGSIRNEVRRFVQDTFQLLGVDGAKGFEIRLYRCLPSVNVFRVDDELFWGPYLMHEQSRNTPTFVVKREGLLFNSLMDHFERIWSDPTISRSVPEEWVNSR